jgi:hypothetical protein
VPADQPPGIVAARASISRSSAGWIGRIICAAKMSSLRGYRFGNAANVLATRSSPTKGAQR